MEFNELLNQYMDQIPCSAKDLSLTSGISASAISRYRSGQRTPSKEDLQNLSESLCRIAEDNGSEIDPDKLRTSLYASLPNLDVDRVSFTGKFSLLMQTLPINRKQLSEYAGYDPSFLSKILSGDRAPSDFVSFATSISDFTAEFCIREGHLNLLGDLIKENVSDIQEESAISKVLCAWLLAKDGTESREKSEQDAIHSFLKKLDDFDLNDYMKRIHFDKIPTPTSPLRATGNKSFTGAEGMKKAELEFLKRTALSSSKEPFWQYSSLPMEELAKDESFSKKWMIGLAIVLKKGIPIHIIHDLNRPFSEIMLGLESWIPLYMTGLIHPYYFKTLPPFEFRHLIRVSGNCAMVGECIGNDLTTAVFFLTSKKDEMEGLRLRRYLIFKKATPLMHIYGEDNLDQLREDMEKEAALNEPVTITDTQNAFYKNMSITLYGDRCVVISKKNDPPIHLMIRHPRLIEAITKLKDLPPDAPGPFA